MTSVPSQAVKAVLGPTNTGKTHFAVERMLAHPGGLIGAVGSFVLRHACSEFAAWRRRRKPARNRHLGGGPGWLVNPLRLNIASVPDGGQLSWASEPDANYTVQGKDNVSAPLWMPVTNLTATGTSTVITDATVSSNRIYRVGTVLPYPTP